MKDRAFEEQERANAVYDGGLLDANNWPPHLRARLLGDTQASDETNQNFSGSDRFQLANAPETTREDAAGPVQIAEAPDAAKPNPAIVADPDALVRRATATPQWIGGGKECVDLVKKEAGLGRTSTWRAGDTIKATDDPPLKPGTAIATFRPDSNGDMRYPQERDEPGKPRIPRHAGIFTRYGEKDGRAGIWMMDQYNDRQNGRAQERFYPFQRRPGERGYNAGQFSTIQRDGQGR